MDVPFEMNALSAHRTPAEVESFARNAKARGIRVIIAGAGMAAALPGVIAASTTVPVIGVPIKGMLDGLDAMLSIIQMPPGIPVATVGVNGAQNAAILAVEMLALADEALAKRLEQYKDSLKEKSLKPMPNWQRCATRTRPTDFACSWIYLITIPGPRMRCASATVRWAATIRCAFRA